MTLIQAIRAMAGRKRRVALHDLWRAFARAHPQEARGLHKRSDLERRLRSLEDDEQISLPAASGKRWDRTAHPALPEWVMLSAVPATAQDAAPPIPWAPELAFMADDRLRRYRQDALAIQEFLANSGRSRPMVPSRERSVELFGDEKRLDALLKSPLFAEGRLSLDTLRCHALGVPLALERGPAGTTGQPCLVIENHHTWWSFCRWNQRVGAYSAVVYGSGSALGRGQVEFLVRQCADWQTCDIHYFGDLDPSGLRIPARAARQVSNGVRILPATAWIQLLLRQAEQVDLPVGRPLQVKPEDLGWLEPPEQAMVRGWFARGVRIPQELVGTDCLRELPAVPLATEPDDR